MELTANSSCNQTEQTQSVLSGINVQTAPVHVGDAEYNELEGDDIVNVTVGVFFDGTLNNRRNTQARLEYEKKQAGRSYNKKLANTYDTWYTFKKSGSYDNDFSNVSRMEPAYEKFEEEGNIQFSLYVEGIGTEDLEDDSGWGAGTGKGITGVKGKVKKACVRIAKLLEEHLVKKINRLQIDVYGFSRGAAAARNFIYEINQKKGDPKEVYDGTIYQYLGDTYKEDGGVLGEELAGKGITTRLKTVVRFAGLYDTVASFGLVHFNDTKQLHLDAVSKAGFTFQLAAADEHRANFRLTNIASAGKGKEKFLPGVHSDIGGGYTDKTDEEVTLDYTVYTLRALEEQRLKLIEQGWYLPGEITVDEFWGTLVGKRKQLSNKYSHIPLHVMVEYSQEKKVRYDFSQITNKYNIVNEKGKKVKLTDVKARIDAYIKGNKGPITFNTPDDKTMLKHLRNEYFHFSAHYNNRVAGVIPAMKPNRVDGERKRIIQNG